MHETPCKTGGAATGAARAQTRTRVPTHASTPAADGTWLSALAAAAHLLFSLITSLKVPVIIILPLITAALLGAVLPGLLLLVLQVVRVADHAA